MFAKIKKWFIWFFTGESQEEEVVCGEAPWLVDPVNKKENTDDDLNSLMRHTEEYSLDSVYPYQYVQNETPYYELRDNNSRKVFVLAHTPVMQQTLTGTVYIHDEPIYTFFAKEDNTFTFDRIGGHSNPAFSISGGCICLKTGDLQLTFEQDALPNHYIVVSYEYDYANENQNNH